MSAFCQKQHSVMGMDDYTTDSKNVLCAAYYSQSVGRMVGKTVGDGDERILVRIAFMIC